MKTMKVEHKSNKKEKKAKTFTEGEVLSESVG
jgi:hypothetical protein